jgi:hypothetical protein
MATKAVAEFARIIILSAAKILLSAHSHKSSLPIGFSLLSTVNTHPETLLLSTLDPQLSTCLRSHWEGNQSAGDDPKFITAQAEIGPIKITAQEINRNASG